MKYVIIGNSAAAIGAVEGIRQVDAEGEIFVVSSEPHHTYSRPLISYLLLGKVTEENMLYRDENFYDKMDCKLFLGKTAVKVDAKAKQVTLSDGQVLDYDKLLVATGSSAFVPPIPGLETVPEVFTFMSLDDAHRLKAALNGKKKVLIVGAGLIGLKCAEGILHRCGSITVVDLAPQVLSSILDKQGADLVQQHLENRGISFRLADGLEWLNGGTAQLTSGETTTFDVLVLAVGVRPNVALLQGIAQTEKGIVIDEYSQTTAPDIYAAGDCAQATDVSTGQSKVMALLPNAYMQGECAGINMAGVKKSFAKALPMNAIGFFGLHMITAGAYSGQVYAEDGENRYKRLFYQQNRLMGYILIGQVEKAGIYTSLIRERTPLDSIDFELACQNPSLMAFARENRMQKLGGVV